MNLKKKKKKLKEPVNLMKKTRYKMNQMVVPVKILLNKKLEVHRCRLQGCQQYLKCNKQNGGWECGYYVMHWMSTIVRARIIDGWMEMFDDVAALSIDTIREIRTDWANQFLEVRNRLYP